MEHGNEKKLNIVVIVDGEPQKRDYAAVIRVEEVIKSVLPPGEKQNWDKYILSDRTHPLDANKSLQENGVKDGDTLSLTKKDGGGGEW